MRIRTYSAFVAGLLTAAGCLGPSGVDSGRILAWTSNGSIFLQRGEEAVDTLGRGFYPALSPDGNRVACIRDVPGTQSSEIVLFDLATGAESRILESPDMLMDLSWSPDGRALAFVAGSLDGSRVLQVCAPDGSSSATLYSASGRQGLVILRPSWLPGSQGLVYNDESSLYKVFFDGTSHEWMRVETLTHSLDALSCADRFVVCPADTTLIAYTRLMPATTRLTVETSAATTHALFMFDSDAGSSLQITTSNMCAMDPVWASDGSTIFFSGYNSTMADQGVQAVYSLDLSSGRCDVVAFGQSPDAN